MPLQFCMILALRPRTEGVDDRAPVLFGVRREV